ncbi:hypothetical protein K378_01375 [Streptomyces sp. Amel2xB2]|uniref:hypothetical protein n=1 Tax=Streptomyces sp. Amel2xB2 TaxID=1305829 RepID=UPI000DC00DC9|nr:hypothetical protein [Streptomyces sp. Amel2xB2]RAJ70210.1 hypothetical protein K378_01375 [Streptomyces sp. Amel2xB2]
MSGQSRVIGEGARYGRLTVLATRHPGETHVQCRCACGTEKAIPVKQWGHTQSCGCAHRRHGYSGTRIYWTWADMINRCTNPTHKQWRHYGGRGITVCPRWRASFVNFLADMGERPPGMSLDRINNDGPYTPSNCRWTDHSTQSKNRRPLAYAGNRNDPATGRFLPKEVAA